MAKRISHEFSHAAVPAKEAAPARLSNATNGIIERLRFLEHSGREGTLSSALDVERHLTKVKGLNVIIARREQTIRTSGDLSPKQKDEALIQLNDVRHQHQALIQSLEQQRNAFRVGAFSESASNLTELNDQNVGAATRALEDLQSHPGIAALSQEHRQEVAKTLTALSEKLSKFARAQPAGKKDTSVTMAAMELLSRLQQTIVPEGAGPHLRFRQAKYKLGISYASQAKKLLKSSEVKSQLTVATTKVDQQARKRYPAIQAENMATHSDVSRIEMLESAGLAPTHSLTCRNENLYLSVEQLRDLTQSQNAAYFYVTGHGMTVSTDPKTNTYRFFDPNHGLYVFHDPDEFAEQIIHFVNSRYNHSKYSPYHHVLENGPQSPASSTMREALQRGFQIKQSLLGGDRDLRQGICAAMSSHVARWMLEHPSHEGRITSEMLELDEFQPQIAALHRGDTLLQMQFLKKARQQYSEVARRMAKEDGEKKKIADAVTALALKDGTTGALKFLAGQLEKNLDDVFLRALEKTYLARQMMELQSAKDARERPAREARNAVAEGDALMAKGSYERALARYLGQAMTVQAAVKDLATLMQMATLEKDVLAGVDAAVKFVSEQLKKNPSDVFLQLLEKAHVAQTQIQAQHARRAEGEARNALTEGDALMAKGAHLWAYDKYYNGGVLRLAGVNPNDSKYFEAINAFMKANGIDKTLEAIARQRKRAPDAIFLILLEKSFQARRLSSAAAPSTAAPAAPPAKVALAAAPPATLPAKISSGSLAPIVDAGDPDEHDFSITLMPVVLRR